MRHNSIPDNLEAAGQVARQSRRELEEDKGPEVKAAVARIHRIFALTGPPLFLSSLAACGCGGNFTLIIDSVFTELSLTFILLVLKLLPDQVTNHYIFKLSNLSTVRNISLTSPTPTPPTMCLSTTWASGQHPPYLSPL